LKKAIDVAEKDEMNLLTLFAHPDDETMLIGGTLALLSQAGFDVHYLCATRGEGGEMGEPPLCTRQELGEVREQELVCAVQALGGRSLTFLGYTDPPMGEREELYAFTDDLRLLAGQVATSIAQLRPVALITHGSNGEYGHPAHVVTHLAAKIAVESLGEDAPLLYSVSAAYPEHPKPRLANKDDPADLVIDVSPVMLVKERAALCHRTQHALFVRRASMQANQQLSVPEVLLHQESLHRVFPHIHEGDADPIKDALEASLLL
jgi:LmbE family N-acetylglucosaminyl deacetylase